MNSGKYYVVTFGCQMNVHDSEKLAGLLESIGYVEAERESEADIILLNTCCVREKAEQKLFTKLGRIRKLKNANPDLLIGVCGCIAQNEGEEIFKRAPHVDIILGTRSINHLPGLIQRVKETRTGQCSTGFTDLPESTPAFVRKSSVIGYVTIMEGCNNFCSYCIVPFVRGREISRLSKTIIEEVRQLASEGYLEVQLLGQNVNSYFDKKNGVSFPDLLDSVAQIEGIRRIRFITSHPKDFKEDIVQVMSDHENICKAIHLPPQSGSNAILKAMNRRYSRERYLEIISMLKSNFKSIALSGDIIVGFPGETEHDFKDTLDLVSKVEFSQLFTFVYSPRPNTSASRLNDDVPMDEKIARLQELQTLQKNIQLDAHEKMIGSFQEVLVDSWSAKYGDQLAGRTTGNLVVNIKAGEQHIGRFETVEITDVGAFSLRGGIVSTLTKGKGRP